MNYFPLCLWHILRKWFAPSTFPERQGRPPLEKRERKKKKCCSLPKIKIFFRPFSSPRKIEEEVEVDKNYCFSFKENERIKQLLVQMVGTKSGVGLQRDSYSPTKIPAYPPKQAMEAYRIIKAVVTGFNCMTFAMARINIVPNDLLDNFLSLWI